MSDKAYKMPPVELGQTVLWYPGGETNEEPLVAKVTKVGEHNTCLAIFHTNSHNLTIRDGVRHVSDPRRKVVEMRESGAWDYTPAHKRLWETLTRMKEQTEALLKDLGVKGK